MCAPTDLNVGAGRLCDHTLPVKHTPGKQSRGLRVFAHRVALFVRIRHDLQLVLDDLHRVEDRGADDAAEPGGDPLGELVHTAAGLPAPLSLTPQTLKVLSQHAEIRRVALASTPVNKTLLRPSAASLQRCLHCDSLSPQQAARLPGPSLSV